jgi:hypothetical protein
MPSAAVTRAPVLVVPGRLLGRTLFATAVIFLLLEIWRPYYFLTDDNLSVGLPFLTEMGRHLKSGQSPFYSNYLFGGHYNLLRDANYFSWSPVNFVVSLLADTPGRFAMLDLVALLNILLSATGFVLLAAALRAELSLRLSDGRLLFLTLSFVFSTFILTCGASWVNFLANQAVLPWLTLGLWQTTWRRSIGLLTLFSLHEALSGQSAGTISNGLILSLFALLVCAQRRSLRPLGCWIAANLLTLLVISPILLPALGGFLHSQRGGGLSVELLHRFNMPAALFPTSFLFGNYFEMAAYFAHIQAPSFFLFPRLPTLLACAAAWCVFPLVCQRRRWTLLEAGCGGLIALLALMVIRPIAITEFMSHVPILRSMRWPFREILQLLFFFHLLLVIRPWAGGVVFQNRIACFSLALFALPLFFTRPLSLNPLTADRAAILSGSGDRFWAAVKTHLRPGDEIATVMDPDVWYKSIGKVPYSLAGTADFPAYFRVRCLSGYSQTAPLDQLAVPVRPYFWFGAYDPTQVPLITKGHPEVRLITVTRFQPLSMTLSAATPGDAPIDLTPLLARSLRLESTIK